MSILLKKNTISNLEIEHLQKSYIIDRIRQKLILECNIIYLGGFGKMLLDYKIKFYKRKLNQMIEKEKSYDEILKVSRKLDVLINKKMFEKNGL